jgi:hypothetical protein
MQLAQKIFLHFCFWSLAAAAAAQSIGGTYAGYYQCAVTRNLDLQVTDLGGGRISAIFYFPMPGGMPGRSASGSYSMSGTYNPRNGQFRLEPQQWINRPQGFNMIGLAGAFDPRTRRLTGNIPSFGCSRFELGPPGPAAPKPPVQAPPVTQHAEQPYEKFGMEYWDATMAGPQGQARESEPIDDVIDWLLKQKFSCMGTRHVTWDASGTHGSVADAISVRERYVIECSGNCRGLRYLPYTDAQIYHFNRAQPAPVMEMKTWRFGGVGFRWEFRRPPDSDPPPDVYVHRWTSSGFNSGGDCRAPKSGSEAAPQGRRRLPSQINK